MSNPSLETLLLLRRPALLFGTLGLALASLTALAIAAWVSGGFTHFDLLAAQALVAPALLGAVLAAFSLGPKLRGGATMKRWMLLARAAGAFAAAGFAWPLSFGIAVMLQGDTSTALSSLFVSLAGLLVGALGGALGALAASYLCFTRT